jgi:hypothetical protein
VSRRIEPVPAFKASVAALPRTLEVCEVLDALIGRVTARPEEAEVVPDTNARTVYSLRTPSHPPLRLFYSINATTLYLLHVEEYDDLLDAD